MKPKRMRTMARQVYAFAVAKARGWDGPADRLIAHGIEFMAGNGRTDRGGWVRTLNVDGSVADPAEDAYDHSCVLLALAHAHLCGNPDALRLGEETFAFLDAHLEDGGSSGFLETPDGEGDAALQPAHASARSLPCLASVTGDARLSAPRGTHHRLFRSHFFDPKAGRSASIFDDEWQPEAGEKGTWTEPGHHFEWASLLVDFAAEERPDGVDRLMRESSMPRRSPTG